MVPKLTWFQYVTLMVVINLGTTTQSVPSLVVNFTSRSNWMVAFIMFGGVLLSAGVTHWFVRTFPGKTMNQAYLYAFGNIMGRITGLWVVLWFYITDSIVFKEVNIFLSDTFFPNTRPFLIGLPLMLVVAFVVWLDIVVITRMAEFILPLVVLFLIVFPLSLMNADLQQLLPLLPDSWSDVWKASVSPTFTYMIEFMVSLMLIDVVPNAKQLSRYLIIAGLITVSMQAAEEFLVTTVLGEASRGIIYPMLEVVRSIRIGKYIERLDILIVMGIITAGFFKAALFNYGMVKSIRELSFVSSNNSVIFLSAVAIWTGSLALFPSNADTMEVLLKFTPSYFLTTLVGLPVLAIIVQLTRQWMQRKRAKS